MNRVEELIQYFNNAYGRENEWPKTFEVSAELYGRCCQVIFNWTIEHDYRVTDSHFPGYYGDIYKVALGSNKGLMFKNVELIIKKEPKPLVEPRTAKDSLD